MKPQLYIVGSAKAGTTSLVDYLSQHKSIATPLVKEPSFFTNNFGLSSEKEYQKLYKGNKIHIDATTNYLFDPGCAQRISEYNKDAIIIILLRKPTNMMTSFYNYMKLTGDESESFADAINLHEIQRRKSENSSNGYWGDRLYLDRALYSSQVIEYLKYFGDNVLIFIFEDFIKNQLKYLNLICDKLNIERFDNFNTDVKNEAGTPRFKLLSALRNREYPILRRLIPFQFRSRIRTLSKRLNTSNKKPSIPVIPLQALDIINDDISRLEQLLGFSIDVWK